MELGASAEAEVIRAPEPPSEPRVLTMKDRCDYCPAQAWYLTMMTSGELLWCYHHFHEHEKTLREISYHIIDQSELCV
jgi:hypothetical protein